MKNKIAILFGIILCAASAPAEVVESVSYNPSRLGQFERLKISDRLNAPGGVQSSRLTVRANNRVTMQNAGNYQLDYAFPSGKVSMPAAQFEAATLNTRGGEGEFSRAGSDYTSTIGTLQGDLVRLKANVLRVNQINVRGTPAASYDGNSIQGLVLGLNDIPNPSSTGACTLKWVERRADDGNKYQVLATVCKGQTPSCNKTCSTNFTLNPNTCECECKKTCPSGKKLNPSTCTCVSEGQWCLSPTSARKAQVWAFDGNYPQNCYHGDQGGVTHIPLHAAAFSPYVGWFWHAARYCLQVSDPYTAYSSGANLRCTPGKACPACAQSGNQQMRWVFNFQTGTLKTGLGNRDAGTVEVYAWDEARCQYASEDCSKLTGSGLQLEGELEFLKP